MLFKRGEGPRVLKFHLGSITHHTVYEAELVGLLLALHLLRDKRDVDQAIVRLDNQAVLYTLKACESGPTQSIIDKIITQIEYNANTVRSEAYQLDIAWVKGHAGNKGKERADKEAKEAAAGCASRGHALTAFLTDASLPLSIAAHRQAFDKELKARWR